MEAGESQDLQVSWQAVSQESWWWNSSLSAKVWEPRKPRVLFHSEGQQTQDPGRGNVSIWVWRQKKGLCPSLKAVRQERLLSYSEEGPPFGSIQAFNWLGETHPH